MQLFPTGILDWVKSKKLIGYFWEFDLDYRDKLHDLHNDYPIAGEKIEVTKEMLSNYQLKITWGNFSSCQNKNLTPNLCNNRKYKLHNKDLKFCLRLGLQLINNS